MSMQNLGAQTKSIIAFLKVAYQGKRIPVPATAETVSTGKKNLVPYGKTKRLRKQ